MKRLLFASLCALFAACGPNDIGAGSTSNGGSGGNSTGGGSSTGGTGAGTGSTGSATGGTTGAVVPQTCSPTSAACPSSAPTPLVNQYYPGGNCGTSRGGVFPDYPLGFGFWNPGNNGLPVSDLNLTPVQILAFHYLYCSGFKYAFIDISAVWCPHCQDEAKQLPGWNGSGYAFNAQAQTGYAVKWLAEGGLILSVLEQSSDPSSPATQQDLQNWVTQYHVNYPMAIDPEENLVSATALTGWPTNIILDLSTMKVVEAVAGDQPTFYQTFDSYLAAGG